MRLTSLDITDFRSYHRAVVELTAGTTVFVGGNGSGKTNLVEAVAWLATGASFRGATDDALVRVDADAAILRAEAVRGERALSIEAQINRSGRNRVLVNRQRLQRIADLADALQVTVFSPDDLDLVKGGPSRRRDFCDRVLAALHARHRADQHDVERVLRQRNTLLRQAGGRRSTEIDATLDVWDEKLALAGTALAEARDALVTQLQPHVAQAYDTLAGTDSHVRMRCVRSNGEVPLAEALAARRDDDLRRGTTTVGPHRDELELEVAGMPARTHCSQGEQRSLALSLRLGSHRLLHESLGATPLLVLDDVFSELDDDRATALLNEIPSGQVLVTTASRLPDAARPDAVIEIASLEAGLASA